MKFSLPAPAKINRFLHIIGRRADGYHNLQTLFQFLDYSDTLSFETRDDDRIVLNTLSPPLLRNIPLENNLIYRAAKALQHAAKVEQGITITINKILPIGAGLGGGSSNAATTLAGLNIAWQCGWSQEALMELGATLGADVPIFLFGHTAWGEGTGTQLTHAEIAEPWVLVIVPPTPVITASIFADPDLTRDTPAFKIDVLEQSALENFLSTLKNDFEPLVCNRYPEVNAAMQWLSNFGEARLSGSGASVFCCFPSQEAAQSAARQQPSQWKGFIAKGINRSPLMQAIREL